MPNNGVVFLGWQQRLHSWWIHQYHLQCNHPTFFVADEISCMRASGYRLCREGFGKSSWWYAVFRKMWDDLLSTFTVEIHTKTRVFYRVMGHGMIQPLSHCVW